MDREIDRSLAMLATAMEKEEMGWNFYKDAAAKCSNELGRGLFRTLMEEEGVHMRRVKQIYDSLYGGDVWSEHWKSLKGTNEDLDKLMKKRIRTLGPQVKPESRDLEAVEIGLQMEQGAINFYREQLEKAVDPLEREFVGRMITEERTHFAALEDLKLFFTNPESWFIEHEHHVLDGA